jgi:uncharacterized protein YchJ
MQTEVYRNGDMVNRILFAPTHEELRERLKAAGQAAIDNGAIEIRQAVMEPERLCPCKSGRKTKNCCLRRYRAAMADAGLPVPVLD